MKPSERRKALARIHNVDFSDFGYDRTWKEISKWIKQMVKIEPKVMREVSKATFGDLGKWLEKGEGKVKACGCLVGTVALKMLEDRNHFKVVNKSDEITVLTCTTNEFEDEGHGKGAHVNPWEVVSLLARKAFVANMREEAEEIGCGVAGLGGRLGQGTAVELIKDEIVRALKARAAQVKRLKLAK